jgi:hypothetical protein
MATEKPPKRKAAGSKMARIYTLDVSLASAPVTTEFAKRNPVVSRTIEVRGTNTLDQLHEAIFRAFDRFDPHMYEFEFGESPMYPKGRRVGLPLGAFGPIGPGDEDDPEDAMRTRVDSLYLSAGDAFGYLFDFGDAWWHRVDVVSIEGKAAKGRYPRITQRVGESPPQYVDEEEWDEDEEDSNGEDEAS